MAEGDLLKIATAANAGVLNLRIAAAIEQTATFILAGGGSPTDNNKRFALAALQDPLTEANRKWIWIVASNSGVFSHAADLTQVSDATINTIIAANWPLLWA